MLRHIVVLGGAALKSRQQQFNVIISTFESEFKEELCWKIRLRGKYRPLLCYLSPVRTERFGHITRWFYYFLLHRRFEFDNLINVAEV